MLKITRAFLIFLLSLLHYVTCYNMREFIQEELSNVSGKMGSCAEYFKYQQIDEFVNGKLELPNIKMGDTVKMTFYRIYVYSQSHFNGLLLPDESSQMVTNRIQNGQMITYRVDFPIAPHVPELIKILVNGNELCSTKHNRSFEEYEILVLRHKMQFVNGSLPVFTHNIKIPNFVKNATYGIVDDKNTNSGLTPLANNGSEIAHGEYPSLAAIAEICGISGTELRSENPWLAAIYYKAPTGLMFLYTGLLISSRTILTDAASIVNADGTILLPDFFRIYLGRYDFNNIHENEVVTRDVATFITHPDYDRTSLSDFQENGILLIQMKSPVAFTDFVKPICLWSEPNDEQSYSEGLPGALIGWVVTGVYYDILTVPTTIAVNTTSIEQCQSWGYDEGTSSRILCIPRLENKNGASLMIKRDKRWLLRGINALRWDYDVYMSREYLMYFDIAKYLPWIQENMLP